MFRVISTAVVIGLGLSGIGAWAAPPEPNEVPAVRTLEQGDQVTGVAFSPDGAKLASAGCCRLGRQLAQVKVWSSRTGALLHALEGDRGGWRAVAFSPDGSSLAGGGITGKLQVWDPETGQMRWAAQLDETPSDIFSVAFAPDGKLLAGRGAERDCHHPVGSTRSSGCSACTTPCEQED